MYADKKSDETVVTDEETEQREESPGGGRGGKGLTRGEQPTGGRGLDTEPSCHADPIGGCGDLCGGWLVTAVPCTATMRT
jgi:hypothetical protein